MSDFIRVNKETGPVTIARAAILHTAPTSVSGTRITLRDSLTTLDVVDSPETVADQLAPKEKPVKAEPEPKPDPKATK